MHSRATLGQTGLVRAFTDIVVITSSSVGTDETASSSTATNSRNGYSVWMLPMPWLPVASAFRILRQFQYACSQGPGWVLQETMLSGIRLYVDREVAWRKRDQFGGSATADGWD